MKKLKFLAIIVLIFHSNSSIAQGKDFVVLVTNDTIFGDAGSLIVKRKGIQIRIKGAKRIYDFERVISRYSTIGGKYLDRVELPDRNPDIKYHIVERVNKDKGRVNIYLLDNSYSDSGHNFSVVYTYISKEGAPLKPLPIKYRRFIKKKAAQILLPYLKDNPEIASELQKEKPKRKEFLGIINRYNQSFDIQ